MGETGSTTIDIATLCCCLQLPLFFGEIPQNSSSRQFKEKRPVFIQREIEAIHRHLSVDVGLPIQLPSVQPLSMKYQFISIQLCAMGVAGTAPKVQGVAA